jgi:hypothetical protein
VGWVMRSLPYITTFVAPASAKDLAVCRFFACRDVEVGRWFVDHSQGCPWTGASPSFAAMSRASVFCLIQT